MHCARLATNPVMDRSSRLHLHGCDMRAQSEASNPWFGCINGQSLFCQRASSSDSEQLSWQAANGQSVADGRTLSELRGHRRVKNSGSTLTSVGSVGLFIMLKLCEEPGSRKKVQVQNHDKHTVQRIHIIRWLVCASVFDWLHLDNLWIKMAMTIQHVVLV